MQTYEKFQCMFLKTIVLSSPCNLIKTEFVKTVMSSAYYIGVYRNMYLSWTAVINYWSGMHKTAFLVIFKDPYELDNFDNIVIYT